MENTVENQKTQFWAKRAASAISVMRDQKIAGLFPKNEGWRNVVEHELVESEAVDVLGEMLGLSVADRSDLRIAALAHDIFKRKEIEGAREKGSEEFDNSVSEQSEFLRLKGYPEEIIILTQAVGHMAFNRFINDYHSLSLSEKIMHYIDDITLRSDLVTLEKRINYLIDNPAYNDLNERGRKIYDGKTLFEVQAEISEKIQIEFAQALDIDDPAALPLVIREKIEQRIKNSS
ncbi:MAG: hypothetical protein A3B38_02705 [Candidatus Levybacteria bacterium RIFCSPLOWO2_01_FULL_36_13]|nr:MAG: hypothetical protein A2684_03900 [Candidatus Levybacteria bacterium RIFCSPHIGHO2_01_FULL_36_15b]OGH35188.1 MAG: hypothetical protein A3B38_02705 [Candidatus Levybacteria bacterium RIFCSPLOWO2_01_FULL_36_13]